MHAPAIDLYIRLIFPYPQLSWVYFFLIIFPFEIHVKASAVRSFISVLYVFFSVLVFLLLVLASASLHPFPIAFRGVHWAETTTEDMTVRLYPVYIYRPN